MLIRSICIFWYSLCVISLSTVARWSEERLQRLRTDESYKLFIDGHVINVEWSPLDDVANDIYHYVRVSTLH